MSSLEEEGEKVSRRGNRGINKKGQKRKEAILADGLFT